MLSPIRAEDPDHEWIPQTSGRRAAHAWRVQRGVVAECTGGGRRQRQARNEQSPGKAVGRTIPSVSGGFYLKLVNGFFSKRIPLR